MIPTPYRARDPKEPLLHSFRQHFLTPAACRYGDLTVKVPRAMADAHGQGVRGLADFLSGRLLRAAWACCMLHLLRFALRADDMGLGKTITAFTLVDRLYAHILGVPLPRSLWIHAGRLQPTLLQRTHTRHVAHKLGFVRLLNIDPKNPVIGSVTADPHQVTGAKARLSAPVAGVS